MKQASSSSRSSPLLQQQPQPLSLAATATAQTHPEQQPQDTTTILLCIAYLLLGLIALANLTTLALRRRARASARYRARHWQQQQQQHAAAAATFEQHRQLQQQPKGEHHHQQQQQQQKNLHNKEYHTFRGRLNSTLFATAPLFSRRTKHEQPAAPHPLHATDTQRRRQQQQQQRHNQQHTNTQTYHNNNNNNNNNSRSNSISFLENQPHSGKRNHSHNTEKNSKQSAWKFQQELLRKRRSLFFQDDYTSSQHQHSPHHAPTTIKDQERNPATTAIHANSCVLDGEEAERQPLLKAGSTTTDPQERQMHVSISPTFRIPALGLAALWTLLRAGYWAFEERADTLPSFFVVAVYVLPGTCQVSAFTILAIFVARLVHGAQEWQTVQALYILPIGIINICVWLLAVLFAALSHMLESSSDDDDDAVRVVLHVYYGLGAVFNLLLVVVGVSVKRRLDDMASRRDAPWISPYAAMRERVACYVFVLVALSRALVEGTVALFPSLAYRSPLMGPDSAAGDSEDYAGVQTVWHQCVAAAVGVGAEIPRPVPIVTFLLLLLWEVMPAALIIAYFGRSTAPPSTSKRDLQSYIQLWMHYTFCCCPVAAPCDEEDEDLVGAEDFLSDASDSDAALMAGRRGGYMYGETSSSSSPSSPSLESPSPSPSSPRQRRRHRHDHRRGRLSDDESSPMGTAQPQVAGPSSFGSAISHQSESSKRSKRDRRRRWRRGHDDDDDMLLARSASSAGSRPSRRRRSRRRSRSSKQRRRRRRLHGAAGLELSRSNQQQRQANSRASRTTPGSEAPRAEHGCSSFCDSDSSSDSEYHDYVDETMFPAAVAQAQLFQDAEYDCGKKMNPKWSRGRRYSDAAAVWQSYQGLASNAESAVAGASARNPHPNVDDMRAADSPLRLFGAKRMGLNSSSIAGAAGGRARGASMAAPRTDRPRDMRAKGSSQLSSLKSPESVIAAAVAKTIGGANDEALPVNNVKNSGGKDDDHPTQLGRSRGRHKGRHHPRQRRRTSATATMDCHALPPLPEKENAAQTSAAVGGEETKKRLSHHLLLHGKNKHSKHRQHGNTNSASPPPAGKLRKRAYTVTSSTNSADREGMRSAQAEDSFTDDEEKGQSSSALPTMPMIATRSRSNSAAMPVPKMRAVEVSQDASALKSALLRGVSRRLGGSRHARNASSPGSPAAAEAAMVSAHQGRGMGDDEHGSRRSPSEPEYLVSPASPSSPDEHSKDP